LDQDDDDDATGVSVISWCVPNIFLVMMPHALQTSPIGVWGESRTSCELDSDVGSLKSFIPPAS
jgi:hypothetical protein